METPATYGYKLVDSFGYLHRPEMDFYKAVVRYLPKMNPLVVNIGIGAATSIFAVIEEKPMAEIYAVDLVADMGQAQFVEGGIDSLIHRITGDSKEVALTWDKPIDILFIDGDHSYEGASEDLKRWTPFLAEGGVVLIHDYDSEVWPDVTRAVDTLLEGFYRVGKADTLIAFSRFDTTWLGIQGG